MSSLKHFSMIMNKLFTSTLEVNRFVSFFLGLRTFCVFVCFFFEIHESWYILWNVILFISANYIEESFLLFQYCDTMFQHILRIAQHWIGRKLMKLVFCGHNFAPSTLAFSTNYCICRHSLPVSHYTMHCLSFSMANHHYRMYAMEMDGAYQTPMKIANAAAALWTGRHITISNRHINFDLNGLVNVSNDFLSQAESQFYTEPINLDGQAGVRVCECRWVPHAFHQHRQKNLIEAPSSS